MMVVPLFAVNVREMEYVTYHPPAKGANPMDALRITFDNDHVAHVPNTGWTAENPALCVMAYLGVSPTRLDEAEGKPLPVEVTQDHEFIPHPSVVQRGADLLDEADWFETE